MKTKTIDDELAKAIGMLIVAWAFIETDKDVAARIARRAAKIESAWVRTEAAEIFLQVGKERRGTEMRRLGKTKKLMRNEAQ